MGNARRRKIEKAIRTSEKYLPDLTDWVLWTRRSLTKGDQKWFEKLKTKFRLHQWTGDEVEEHLSGAAEILRRTYFGELVLTPERLRDIQARAIAPIVRRWQPAVHQTVAAERALRQMLGETEAWDYLRHIDPEIAALPRKLRNAGAQAALSITDTVAHIRLAARTLVELAARLSNRLVAVVADFGCGKTQLAAQLTAAANGRPAGILLHGGVLASGQNLDDLARGVVIEGTPVASMEALVAAVNAAGERAQRRLPILIDGLNEAEDARNWKGPLASLDETLRNYPYVLVVCTVRPAFADEALPIQAFRVEIPGFDSDTGEAIRRYFAYYKIDPTDAYLPWELLSHPLTLRLFCEVTNPKRERVVGIEAMPGSLTALFDRYLKQATERIAELAPRVQRYYEQDVSSVLNEIGRALWEAKTRSLEMEQLRRLLRDDARPWNESIVRALEQDSVLARNASPGGAAHYGVVHDALAGHLIANAVLSIQGAGRLADWLKELSTVEPITPTSPQAHPLAADIFRSLVGLVPRLYHQQLWRLLSEPLQTTALRAAIDLEGASLDAETVQELKRLAAQSPIFVRLWQTRGAVAHPLNAEFLDSSLRPMAVADRDLLWTEWLRRNSARLAEDLIGLESRWRSRPARFAADLLRARWVMWTLTSTVRGFRDQATRTLYWFGRGNPGALFDLALDALKVNDAYVSERVFAASYGVTMAHQQQDPQFLEALRSFLTGLREALTGSVASDPTNHYLIRLYVQGVVTFALKYYPDAVPQDIERGGRVHFSTGPAVEPIPEGDPRAAEADRTLCMDFKNYTIGALFDDRRNYDMDHSAHKCAVAHVLGTIWTLGWREESFGKIEKELSDYWTQRERGRTERYGKKYGWIGFYTYAGLLDDRGLLSDERMSDIQIDPSFPEPPTQASLDLPLWALPSPATDRRWILNGVVEVPQDLLYRGEVGPHQGPWVAVWGELTANQQTPGRRTFGLLSAMLVARGESDRLVNALNNRGYPGNYWLPREPSDHYTFAGEVPWSPEFGRSAEGDRGASLYHDFVHVSDEESVEVEILAHRYSWESYHSVLGDAGGALVPSRAFSQAFALVGIPQSFDQALPDSSVVAVSLSAPAGFDGHLLYLREDLVRRYAKRRSVVWFAWGERQLYSYGLNVPNWYAEACQKGANIWRLVRRLEELSSPLASRPRAHSDQGQQLKRGKQVTGNAAVKARYGRPAKGTSHHRRAGS